ncbi:type II toxin-antitoxin system Phd/YefM family antitoxin [Pseudosulfitobacter pseudonitzschiae]|uniref:type II toxin-antitoxin system Phd/YefM family antitoxin n=1 Tax=Pseudosulfitobacter pseudonitzschiae TaxID=1402135 RepID=UPI001AF2AF0C|nr:type II toxin-antitoxin system Phd/YefM family antitoxin [Pseudosulfitobacter pseudonitzschiae]MBM1817417.1 type II toxin-antitoxin system Phd/YefM family antitoxin [Pseudosulfitobacter pseudonitzschiae]MBM1834615.1 type II toxin-antitoxin system Phd/YefM family antitoxin [Pseudosulfitobacter pseudonitzschiae]MBM1839479.1 type II toxin-antitoxin system Phd/YefM family antitoxin [Pseudosulfitobacter pseudonitzschiae]MBM1844330.1 type II toxin-antitoxin system Phd/YefM family antitoxin [Pseudo
MKTMTATTASKEFGLFLDTAQREPVVVTKKNRPVTVTLSYQDWEEMVNARIERGLQAGLDDIEQGRFTEISETSTAERIARFQKRASDHKT